MNYLGAIVPLIDVVAVMAVATIRADRRKDE